MLHYLLDAGNTLFDNLAAGVKVKKLGRYRIGQWMDIKPTSATEQAMGGLGWVFKPTTTGFLIATAASGPNNDRPATPPPATQKLEFELVANNAEFGQFSAFPLPGKLNGERALYIFDNSLATVPFPDLTVPPLAYDNAVTYELGSIVTNGGSRFVAKGKTLGNAAVAGAHWAQITEPLPYANAAQITSRVGLPVRDGAFGLVRISCANGLGNFGLFNGQTLRSPTFKIRLRRKTG